MSLQKKIRENLLNSWQRPSLLTPLLLPFSFVYGFLFWLRKHAYALGLFKNYRAPVPVIIVGNITVGGTGKTPLVIYLVELLRQKGYSPGVISRGYSGEAETYPLTITEQTSVIESGDEPALIIKRTGVPMVVGADREASIKQLLAEYKVDIIISDDGLQHLALNRDIELCLIDDTQLPTNQFLLPAGPYRELPTRLSSIEFVIHHRANELQNDHEAAIKYSMCLQASEPVSLSSTSNVWPTGKKIHAAAGIGNPHRFFSTCRAMGFDIIEHAHADHHSFVESDLDFDDDLPVLMTEKDAVKCIDFTNNKLWYLPVNAKLNQEFDAELLALIESK